MNAKYWKLPLMLGLIALLPLIPGLFRLAAIAGAPSILPEDAYSLERRVPVAIHIVAAMVFYWLGALQFSSQIRQKWPGFHRMTGRLIVPFGIAVAVSALWMALLFPRRAEDHQILVFFQVLAGSGMLLSIVLGVAAILARNIKDHRAWMIRAYALGLGAATQIVIVGPFLVVAPPEPLTRALLLGAAWAINLAVAEWFIRRPRRVAGRTALG